MAGPKLRAFRSRVLYRAILLISFVGRRVPLRVGQRLGRLLGLLAWHVARRHRKKALQNIALAFPEWTAAHRRHVIRQMFLHLGTSLVEVVWLPTLDRKRLDETTERVGFEAVAEIVQAGKPIVFFTGHCGNWEWVGSAIAIGGIPVTAFQRERDEGGLNDFITEVRAASGTETIDRGSPTAARELIKVLRGGRMIAFLVDQSLRVESVNVPFFGMPAQTPIGPARMAIRAGAHIVVGFGARKPDGTHVVRFLEPVPTQRGDDPVALTAAITREIEEQIRRVPEQWVWMHDRWRQRPKWLVDSE